MDVRMREPIFRGGAGVWAHAEDVVRGAGRGGCCRVTSPPTPSSIEEGVPEVGRRYCTVMVTFMLGWIVQVM